MDNKSVSVGHDSRCTTRGDWTHRPAPFMQESKCYEFKIIPPSWAPRYDHPEIPEAILKSYTHPDPEPPPPLLHLNVPKRDNIQRSWNLLIIRHKTYTVDIEDFRVLWFKTLLHADHFKIALAIYSGFDLWEKPVEQAKSFTWDVPGAGWGSPWDAQNQYEEDLLKGSQIYRKEFNSKRFFEVGEPYRGWWYRLPRWVWEGSKGTRSMP